MGRQAGTDGLGYMLRKVKSGGGLGVGFGSGWVPTFGKLRKSTSNDLPKRDKLDDDLWGVSEGRLTPNMLPKPLPDDCPPTSPRELLLTARGHHRGRNSIEPCGVHGSEEDLRKKSRRGVAEGGRNVSAAAGQVCRRRRQILDSIQEASETESPTSGDSNARPVTRLAPGVLLPRVHETRGDGPKTTALADPAPRPDVSSSVNHVPSLPPRQNLNLEVLPVPRGLRAALMMSEPQSDHWSDCGEDWCSDVPSTMSGPNAWAAQPAAAVAEDQRWDIFSESSAEDPCEDSGSVSLEAEEFSFPLNVGFVARNVVPDFETWGHWGYSSEEEAGDSHGQELEDDDDSLLEDGFRFLAEKDDSTYAEEGRDGPVYDDGAVYSLEKGDEVYYVQKMGDTEFTHEDDGASYREESEEGSLSSAYLPEEGFPLSQELEDVFGGAVDASASSAHGAEEQEVGLQGREPCVRPAAAGNVEVGPVTFYVGEEDIDPWDAAQDADRDADGDAEGARDRSRESFGSADSAVMLDTALDYRNAGALVNTGDSHIRQMGNNVRACLYDSAHTMGSERDHVQQTWTWETSQLSGIDTGASCPIGPSYSFSWGQKRQGYVPDEWPARDLYTSADSWLSAHHASTESWMTETFPQAYADVRVQRCPTPARFLGNFFRRISEKLHLRSPAPKVPVSVTGGSSLYGGSAFRKRHNRYSKRQASMLKFVEERLEKTEGRHTGGAAHPKKEGRPGRRNRASQAAIHDSAVDLTQYGAEPAAAKSCSTGRPLTRSANNGDPRSANEPVVGFGAGRRGGHRCSGSGYYPKVVNHNPVRRQNGACTAPA